MDLSQKKCVPCEGGVPSFTPDQVQKYKPFIAADWHLLEVNKKLNRTFMFGDFKQAMTFVNKIAELAEEEGHHPDISIFYNIVHITLWTHAIGGLSENDFILARKIDILQP